MSKCIDFSARFLSSSKFRDFYKDKDFMDGYIVSARPLSDSEFCRLTELWQILDLFEDTCEPELVELIAFTDYELREYRYLLSLFRAERSFIFREPGYLPF